MTSLSAVLCAALLAPAAADAKPLEHLVGKWQGTIKDDNGKESQLTVEFLKDGTWSGEAKSGDDVKKFAGTYKVIDEGTVETTIKRDDKEEKETMKVVLDKDKLTVTNSKKKSVEFTRVKAK
jgi:uncharacterized protein (TIGR03066 family)